MLCRAPTCSTAITVSYTVITRYHGSAARDLATGCVYIQHVTLRSGFLKGAATRQGALGVSLLKETSDVCQQLSRRYHLAVSPFPPRKPSFYRMSAIQNLSTFDPFADASKGDDWLPAGTEDSIHIRIQQRNGRKTLTTVQGISDDYDKKKLVKAFKKKFACNGTVVEHSEYGEVIQLQGDQRKNACQFLVEVGLCKDDQLKVHGF